MVSSNASSRSSSPVQQEDTRQIFVKNVAGESESFLVAFVIICLVSLANVMRSHHFDCLTKPLNCGPSHHALYSYTATDLKTSACLCGQAPHVVRRCHARGLQHTAGIDAAFGVTAARWHAGEKDKMLV